MAYLIDDLKKIKDAKRDFIDSYVQKEKPQYRYLLNRKPELYDQIPANLSKEKLELELHSATQKWETEIHSQGREIEKKVNGAVKAIVEMKDYIKKICSESGIVWQEMGIYFTIKLFRIKSPSHIFTEEEIKEVLRAGNDFRNNRLVIDEEGYAQLIDSDLHYECYRYPVSQESYDARNNYVGQYANLDDVGEIYLAMLDGWLHHLRTGQRYDVDYYDQCEDAEKMLAEIKQYYQ